MGMANSSKVTVWNAAQHVLKVGSKRLILHPGTSFIVDRDDELDSLVNSGKLVVMSEIHEPVAEEAPKKKKKEVVETVEESTVVEEVTLKENAEDSILPEEVD
jgi:hypothetical protein